MHVLTGGHFQLHKIGTLSQTFDADADGKVVFNRYRGNEGFICEQTTSSN